MGTQRFPISAEGTIGIALALVGIGGAGALFVLPHPYADYVGWTLIGIAVAGLIMLGIVHLVSRVPPLAATWRLDGTIQGGRARAFSGIALLGVLVGAFYIALHWPLHRPVLPPAPAPPPVSPAPAAPPKPWVTPEEIEAQKKLGRTLLIYSPAELIDMEASEQSIGLFFDKWVKIDYKIAVIPASYTADKKTYDILEILDMPRSNMFVLPGIVAYFDPKKWGDRLLNIRKGGEVKAYCQIQSIERGKPFNQYMRRDVMIAYNCELI